MSLLLARRLIPYKHCIIHLPAHRHILPAAMALKAQKCANLMFCNRASSQAFHRHKVHPSSFNRCRLSLLTFLSFFLSSRPHFSLHPPPYSPTLAHIPPPPVHSTTNTHPSSTDDMTPTQSFRLDEKSPIEEICCSQVGGNNIVFWEDIEQVFPGVQYVKSGNVTISPMRDSNRNR